jgi:hypothetical protein
MYHNKNVGMGAEHSGFADLQIDRLFFLARLQKNGRIAMTIAGQPDGVEGLAAASVADNSEIHHVKVAKFAKLAIAAGTAVILVGLYIGTKQFLSIESFAAEQSRTFHIDIAESCLHGTEPPPVFKAREGDHVALAVTSLYSGELFLHGLETEVNIVPGAENTITFTAEHAGRFYLHLHGKDEDHAHIELAVLEVAPR